MVQAKKGSSCLYCTDMLMVGGGHADTDAEAKADAEADAKADADANANVKANDDVIAGITKHPVVARLTLHVVKAKPADGTR